jgi:hypothetical protein
MAQSGRQNNNCDNNSSGNLVGHCGRGDSGQVGHNYTDGEYAVGLHTDREMTTSDSRNHAESYMTTPHYRAFDPLWLSLHVLGLQHTRRPRKRMPQMTFEHSETAATTDSKYSKMRPTPSQAYAWTISVMAWLVMGSTVASSVQRTSSVTTPHLLAGLIQAVWTALCALNAACFLRISHSDQHIREFFLGLARLQLYGGAFVCVTKTRQRVFIVVVVCWLVSACNAFIFGYLTFSSSVLNTLLTDASFVTTDARRLLVKCMSMLLVIHLSALWAFPSALELSFTMLIRDEFRLFRRAIANKLDINGCCLYDSESLENDRRRLLEMVRVVQRADNCLSLHHGATFCCGIANICLLLYSLVYYPSLGSVPGASLAYTFWLLSAVADMAVVTTGGILVNSAVSDHSVYSVHCKVTILVISPGIYYKLIMLVLA